MAAPGRATPSMLNLTDCTAPPAPLEDPALCPQFLSPWAFQTAQRWLFQRAGSSGLHLFPCKDSAPTPPPSLPSEQTPYHTSNHTGSLHSLTLKQPTPAPALAPFQLIPSGVLTPKLLQSHIRERPPFLDPTAFRWLRLPQAHSASPSLEPRAVTATLPLPSTP